MSSIRHDLLKTYMDVFLYFLFTYCFDVPSNFSLFIRQTTRLARVLPKETLR